MSYQDSDYEDLINRADNFVGRKLYKEAWDCISAIPDDVKKYEFPENSSFFASIALETSHFDHFIRYIKIHFSSIREPNKQFTEELGDIFFTMTSEHGAEIHPYVAQLAEIAVECFPTPEVLNLCAEAYNLIKCHYEALELLDEALDQDPFNSTAWFNKAFSYHFIGDETKEVEACNYFLALEPNTKEYSILLPIAVSYAQAGKHEDALALLKKALGNRTISNEQLANIHCLMAESFNALSDYKRELYHRKKSLYWYPEDVAYWSMLAQYYITSENRPLKAEKIMEDALTRYPNDPVAHYMYSTVECQIAIETHSQRRLDMAARHIESALRKYKDNILFHLMAARIYLLMPNYDQALKHARNSYRMNPNNINAILYMVLATFGCGKLTSFRKLYRIYAKLNPTAREDIITIIPEAQETIDQIK